MSGLRWRRYPLGNARFAIAYETDVLAVDGVEIAAEIPPAYHPPIVYPAAVIKHSDAQGRGVPLHRVPSDRTSEGDL